MKGAVQNRVPPPPPAFRQLLMRRQQKSAQSVMQEALYGSVKLEPSLTCDPYANVSVDFKIGASTMYVLKDVFPFVNALRLGEFVSYGQEATVCAQKGDVHRGVAGLDGFSEWLGDEPCGRLNSDKLYTAQITPCSLVAG